MSLGKRLKQLIDNYGFKNLSEASIKLGIDSGSLSRITNDKQDIAAKKLTKITDFFGVSADWLLTGREPGQKQGGIQKAGKMSGNSGQFQNINGGVNLRYEIGLDELKKEEKEVNDIAELAEKLTPKQREKLLQLIKITLDIDV